MSAAPYVVPGTAGESVRVAVDLVGKESDFANELGLFTVDDAAGRVAGLLPSDPGYTAAALGRASVIFTGTQGAGAHRELSLTPGRHLGFYLVQNSTTAAAQAGQAVVYFGFPGANPDTFDHAVGQTVGPGALQIAWEDLTGGGDQDFNDAVFRIGQVVPSALAVPGQRGQTVPTTFTLLPHDTAYANELGYFSVDDAFGRIGDLFPDSPGYARAALARGVVVFASGAGAGAVNRLDLAGGGHVGLFLVQNASLAALRAQNPTNDPGAGPVAFFSFTAANFDGVEHFRWRDASTVAVEDLTGGGDSDYNDLVARLDFGSPHGDPDVPERRAPVLRANLVRDTAGPGGTTRDRLTSDPTVTGRIVETSRVARFRAWLDDTPAGQATDVLADLQADKVFRFDRTRLQQIRGGLLRDGQHTLHLQAQDEYGNTSTAFAFSFTLDTTVALPAIELEDPFDTPPVGDRKTHQATVAFAGRTDPGATVQLGVGGPLVTADAQGRFRFPDVALPLGTTTLATMATDQAGNTATATRTFERLQLGFAEGLASWTVAESGGAPGARGTVLAVGASAVLREGTSFQTTLSRAFVVPESPTPLVIDFSQYAPDTTDPSFVNDAFEIALVDAAGAALVGTVAPGRDALFNLTEGLAVATGAQTTVTGNRVTVDLSGVPAGTRATLVFRLVNNDSDARSAVQIDGVALPATGRAAGATKFFVVDAGTATTFRYGTDGLGAGTFALASGSASPRGVASNLAGDKVWVLDSVSGQVRIYGPGGAELGNWEASDALDPQGITTDGVDIWLVDRGQGRVLRYAGAAGTTGGSRTATSGFALNAANTSPSDLVTDGSLLWVTDDGQDAVFVYDLAGMLQGRWTLDADNAAAAGLTLNPAGGSDLWVVDRDDATVYFYAGGLTRRAGNQNAAATFQLDASNTAPEGIADPPQSGEGYSLVGPDGRAVFDTATDFRAGTLVNVTAVDAAGAIRLNAQDQTEFANLIWIANSGEGTVSKFDTVTGKELARYRTGPDGTILYPNRTGVTSAGDVWVTNRDATFGTLVKVLNTGFIDRNGNGVVDTSTDMDGDGAISAAEILPWDAAGDGQPDDERIALSIPVGWDRNDPAVQIANAMPRALAIDADDNVWVGLWNARQYELYDNVTGQRLAIVAVNGTPYNAAIDAHGVLWGTSSQLTNYIDTIDTDTRTYRSGIGDQGGTRGVAVDASGLVWFGVFNGQALRHDPVAGTWDYYPVAFNEVSGIAVDARGRVWVTAHGGGVTRLTFAEDRRTLLETKSLALPGRTTSAVFDADGYFWATAVTADLVYKIDPETVTVVPGWPVPTGREPYNYTNNTAQVRLTVTGRAGTWTETVDAGRAGAAWAGVGLAKDTPTGTEVVLRVRTADDADALPALAWRTIQADQAYPDLVGRFLQVEVGLRARELTANPSVQTLVAVSVPPPDLAVHGPTSASLSAGTQVVLDGLATAAQPEFGPSLLVPNRITHVMVNGQPVEVLDSAGRFFTRVTIEPGETRFEVTAFDEYGQASTVVRTLMGETRPAGDRDLSQFVDLTANFRAEYARTSFRDADQTLYADVAIRNVGNYPAGVPLLVGVKNISDPSVRVLETAGTLPDGTPYYDFTGLVTGGATQLNPDAATGTLSLLFANPQRGRFTYDLVFYGVPNRVPTFGTVPELEATVGRTYRYAPGATDPDGDPLTFALVSSPPGMALAGGVLTWTPTAEQVGTFPVVLRVSDGRGGFAEQTFTVVSEASRPNRPPAFTSLPVVAAVVGTEYRYPATASDPDGDVLRFRLVAASEGMSIHEETGVLTWTPTAAQLGHAEVTIEVRDDHGGTATQAFEVCLTAGANRPPVIVSEPVTTVRLTDAVFRPGELFVSSSVTHEIRVYDAVTLAFREAFSHPLFTDGQYAPRGSAFNNRGNLVVSTDSYFIEFSNYGVEYARYRKDVVGPNDAITFDRLGNLYTVTQTGGANTIVQYGANGYQLRQRITVPGSGSLTGLIFDNQNRLYVGSQADRQIHVFSADSGFETFTHLRSFAANLGADGIEGLLFDRDGTLLAVGGGITRFDPETGSVLDFWTAPDNSLPVGIAKDAAGFLIIGDFENGSGSVSADLIRFAPDGNVAGRSNDPNLFGPFVAGISPAWSQGNSFNGPATEVFDQAAFATAATRRAIVTFDDLAVAGDGAFGGNEYATRGLVVVQRDGLPLNIATTSDQTPFGPQLGNFQSGPYALTSSFHNPAGFIDSRTDNIDLIFTTPASAAGLWIGNIGPATTTVEFLDSGGSVIVSEAIGQSHAGLVGAGFNNRIFYGVTSSTPISKIRVSNPANDADGIVLDDIQFQLLGVAGGAPLSLNGG